MEDQTNKISKAAQPLLLEEDDLLHDQIRGLPVIYSSVLGTNAWKQWWRNVSPWYFHVAFFAAYSVLAILALEYQPKKQFSENSATSILKWSIVFLSEHRDPNFIKHCRAVVFKTLHICHPLISTRQDHRSTRTDSRSQWPNIYPPISYRSPLLNSRLAMYSKYWGSNPLAWNPSRFISIASTPPPTGKSDTQVFDEEKVEVDTSNHFIPFAWGQRVYPGRKFAQVELVPVLTALFKDWKFEVVPKQGETEGQVRVRAWKSSLVVDHEMVDPESVGLRWVKR